MLKFREQNRIGKIISDPVSDYKPPPQLYH